MNPVEARPDSEDELMCVIWKAQHIFREVNRVYEFVICTASNLPLLIRSPVHIPVDRDFVCLFGSTLKKDLSAVKGLFAGLEKRALEVQPNPVEHFNLTESLCIETMAHHFRQMGALEPDSEIRRSLFDKAYVLYRSTIYDFSHSSLTIAIENIKAMGKKISCIFPVPDMHLLSTEGRRRIAHCLAGMALCVLMGQHDPITFFGLSSAALSWEPERPLDLANFLRLNLLMMGKFSLGIVMVSMPGSKEGKLFGFATNSAETRDALTGLHGSKMNKFPEVYDAVNKLLLLPAVLRYGSIKMLKCEQEFIRPDQWGEVRFQSVFLFNVQTLLIHLAQSVPSICCRHEPAHCRSMHWQDPRSGYLHAHPQCGWPIGGEAVRQMWRVAE